MSVEVVTPEDYVGAVTGDVSSRRGKIINSEIIAGIQMLRAEVPLSTMFGYATDLRSVTQGRATFTMEFSHYDPMPRSLAEEVISKAQGK